MKDYTEGEGFLLPEGSTIVGPYKLHIQPEPQMSMYPSMAYFEVGGKNFRIKWDEKHNRFFIAKKTFLVWSTWSSYMFKSLPEAVNYLTSYQHYL